MPTLHSKPVVMVNGLGGLLLLLLTTPLQAEQNITDRIALETVISGFRAKQNLNQLAIDLQNKVTAGEAAASAEAGSWNLDFDSEFGIQDNKERRLGIALGRTQTLGYDASSVRQKLAADARAELLATTQERLEKEIEVAKLYTELRFHQKLANAAQTSLDAIEPLVSRAKMAADAGSVGFISLRRWQLLLSKIGGDLEQAKAAFASQATILSELSALKIHTDSSRMTLTEIPLLAVREFKPEAYLPVRAKLLRQQALASEADLVGNRREIELKAGMFRDLESKDSGVSLGVAIPLSAAKAASSKAREILAEKNVLSTETEVLLADGQRRFALLSSSLHRAMQTRDLKIRRTQEVEGLNHDSIGAFKKGQADASELIESFNELYEARRDAAAATREAEDSFLELHYLVSGEDYAAKP